MLDVRAAIEFEELRQRADNLIARVMEDFTRKAPEILMGILKNMEFRKGASRAEA